MSSEEILVCWGLPRLLVRHAVVPFLLPDRMSVEQKRKTLAEALLYNAACLYLWRIHKPIIIKVDKQNEDCYDIHWKLAPKQRQTIDVPNAIWFNYRNQPYDCIFLKDFAPPYREQLHARLQNNA